MIVAFITLDSNQFRYVTIFYVILTGYLLQSSISDELPSVARRFLENRIMRFIGKISFSLYLVHWPIIVISKNLGLETFGLNTFVIFPLMILVSWFLYREVEERCLKITIPTVSKKSAARRTRYFPLNRDAIKYSTFAIVLFISFVNVEAGNGRPLATSIFKSKVVEPWMPPAATVYSGVPTKEETTATLPSIDASRFELWNKEIILGLQLTSLPEGIQPGLSQLDSDRLSRWNECLSILSNSEACNSGLSTARKKVYIVGDSYALSLTPMIQEAFAGVDYHVVSRIRGQCMVPEATPVRNNLADDECDSHRKRVNDEISRVKPDVIIASSWNAAMVVGGDTKLLSGMEKQFTFLKSNSKYLIIVGETPAIPDPRKCFNSNEKINQCIGKASSGVRYRLFTEQIARSLTIPYLNLTPWMCSSNACPPIIDNNFVTWDGGQLTEAFSSKLSPLFLEYLTSIGLFDKVVAD